MLARLRGGRRHPHARRDAPGPDPRRRHREHLGLREPLGSAALPVAPPRATSPSPTGGSRSRPRRASCAPRSRAPASRVAASTARPAGPARGAGRRSARAARATPTAPPTGAPLVSRAPIRGRRPPARRVEGLVAFRAPHLYQSLRAFCLAAFAAERGAELPFAFEEHPTRDGPVALRVPPARAGLRRRAGTDAATAPRHAKRDRGPPARAGRGDLRARPLRGRRDRRRRALPHDPAADAHRRRGAVRRVRLAGRRLRGGLRRHRALALRRCALLCCDRTPGRALGRIRRRSRRRDRRPPRGAGRALGALARGARPDAARVRPRRRPALRARAHA